MDLITVIVPVYKVEKYISKCLESIINQTYKNLEIILVDDCSPDKSSSICDKFACYDKRIKVIHNIQNFGVSVARNIGLDNATGEYITFIDGDDWIDPDMIEKMYFLIKNNVCDIAICGYTLVYPDKLIESDKSNIIRKMNSFETLKEILIGPIKGFLWNKLFRRDLFNNVRLPEELDLFEDLYTCCKILTSELKIVYTSKSLYNYVQSINSITNNYKKYFSNDNELKAIEVLETIKGLYVNNKAILKILDIATANSIMFIYFQILITDTMYQLNVNQKIYLRKKLRKYSIFYLITNEHTIKEKIKYLLLIIAPFLMKKLTNSNKKKLYS